MLRVFAVMPVLMAQKMRSPPAVDRSECASACGRRRQASGKCDAVVPAGRPSRDAPAASRDISKVRNMGAFTSGAGRSSSCASVHPGPVMHELDRIRLIPLDAQEEHRVGSS
jgi:hypothetical protein